MLLATLSWLLLAACHDYDEPPPDPVQTLDTLPIAEVLARDALQRHPPDRLALSWVEAVFGHALLQLADRTGDQAWQEPVEDWLVQRVHLFTDDPPRTFDSSDSMSPSSVASELMLRDPGLGLEPMLGAAHAYLDEARRTAEGAITHWYHATLFLPDDEIWVDSLFMFGMFLLAEHERTGDRAHLDAFVEQYVLFSDLCRDGESQLYHHAYKDSTGENIPADDTFWARGNSWVIIAGAEALSRLDPSDPAYETLLPLVRSHGEAILSTQADDGLWHTVMNQPRGDDPDNYTETAGAALLAYGLLRASGTALSHEQVLPAVNRAVAGVQGRLRERGDHLELLGTSYGTNPGDYDYYVSVPVGRDLLLGVASVILLMTEAHGLEEVW